MKETALPSKRTEYLKGTLAETGLHENPIEQFTRFWNEALQAQVTMPDAMTLATSYHDGSVDARIVLLKYFNEKGFVFGTNYNSPLGLQLGENPHAALVFWWEKLEQQIRIRGSVSQLEQADSDGIWNARPKGAQIAALASDQSNSVASRDILEKRYQEIQEAYEHLPIERPPYWGGYLLMPESMEFWQGRENRLHDRFLYTRISEHEWNIKRLMP